MANILDFEAIKLKLASPDEILDWSHGEVTKPETINYRTQRPEKDGLFCEKIFGPVKDWECYCGKYKRIRYKGIVCDKCGVEVTRSIVRRERMGHIKLAAPVCHIWFLRGVPSKIGLMLDLSVQSLEKVIYFASYVITNVDEEAKKQAFEEIDDEYKSKVKEIKSIFENKANSIKQQKAKEMAEANKKGNISKIDRELVSLYEERDKKLSELKNALNIAKKELTEIKKLKVISEIEYRDLSLKYGHVFEAGIGAEAVRKALAEIDLPKLAEELTKEVEEGPMSQLKKLKRRLRLTKGMIKANIKPDWMIMTVLPVIPPDLRPMVQLDGGRFAASDLNDLYRRVINRNNRLKRLIELRAPEVICRNEKRMLQEAVDALIDNSARRGKAVAASTGQKRVLKSLADMLRGKQGRFRQNLLGKRVDYSGRSVIVVGPELKINQCGIPKKMALELFKPFVINKLIEQEFAHNVRSASRLIEEGRSEIWDILEDVIKGHYVMLNRAPTLHRLGIQAFQPVLIEGKALRIHPMVCTAFNADFDGDQMAVHVPLTFMARKEAKEIIGADRNLLKPATGDPIATPSKDMVLGCYYITTIKPGVKGEGKIFSDPKEAIMAYETGNVDIQAKVKVRINKKLIETCVGRLYFNEIVPEEFGFINEQADKKVLKNILSRSLEKFGEEKTVDLIDSIKEMGFSFLTISGISWGMNDLIAPKEKWQILENATKKVEEIRQQYKSGLLTEDERYTKIIETWAKAKDQVSEVSMKALDQYGSVYSMVSSGARGSWPQVVQMTGMRGLMANPAGKTIELPVKNSFKEGLDVLEYFISTHGARKGLSDTALRTANAGYLTRRLIDVSQDIVVEEEDCGDEIGFPVTKKDSEEMNETIAERTLGRVLAKDIKDKKGKTVVKKGTLVEKEHLPLIEKADPEEVHIRSVMSCRLKRGTCAKCYGWDLGYNKLVKIGQAVGIVAAQSIGEPGTQLTMRTFHTGGVAGESDITQGLPRVEELFEARGVKNPAVIAEIDGIAHVEEERDKKVIRIISKDIRRDDLGEVKNMQLKVKDGEEVKEGKVVALAKNAKKIKTLIKGIAKIKDGHLFIMGEGSFEKEYILPKDSILWVNTGDLVYNGQQLTEGHINLQQLFKTAGIKAVQRYILKEVQYIYSSQGQDVDDKHVEIIVRQMLARVRIKDSGDSDFLEGEVIERLKVEEVNEKLIAAGKRPAEMEDLLLGITKASLSTSSFFSAASFQETARVLIDAAITGKVDEMRGLKENIIIGKLIPSGTGFHAGEVVSGNEEAKDKSAKAEKETAK